MEQDKQDKIWDYWQSTGVNAFKSNTGRLDYVKRLVLKKKAKKVLTIGVGDFYLESQLMQNNIDLFVLDPSETSINKAFEIFNLDSKKAKVGYSQNMPFEDGSFDAVVMSEVLEHLEDRVLEKTIEELYRVLKKGGSFIGTVPYNENLKNAETFCPNCKKTFHRVGHVRSFTRSSMKDTLKNHFDSKRIRLWIAFLPAWKILNFKGRVVGLIIKSLELFSVYSEKSNLIILATK